MNNLNSVLIEGNLTREPELKFLQSGTGVCSLSIATNRSYKQNDQWKTEVSYFEISVFGKMAEICNQYLQKGRGVRIVGRLKQDRWEQDGNQRSRVFIIADHVEFAPQKKETQFQGPQAPESSGPVNDDIPF